VAVSSSAVSLRSGRTHGGGAAGTTVGASHVDRRGGSVSTAIL
jgi:hypothetical protein